MARRAMRPIRLYNSLTRKKEDFVPLEAGKVRMYHCGPTVYAPVHIGNLSAFLLADILRRTLEHFGYDVTQVMNVTDVGHMTRDDVADAAGEDRLERRAREQGLTPWDLARTYTWMFFRDLEAIGIKAAHYYPRATEFVREMADMTERLIERGLAYETPAGDVYFDVRRFPTYGRLSNNTLESLEAGARVEVREDKRHPADFALWKVDPKHVMQWDPTSWGGKLRRGFPGWHIECSVMSQRYLGETFDIHTGGEDHFFPHHECEIAQSEGATGKPFVRYWMHKAFILVEGKKMAKREGNFYTLADLQEKGFTPREVRYLLISTHYRSQQNFTVEGLAAARAALRRVDEARERLLAGRAADGPADDGLRAAAARAREAFDEAIADDLNVSGALAALFDLVRDANRATLGKGDADVALGAFERANSVLGIDAARAVEVRAPEARPAAPAGPPPEVEALANAREAARKAKRWPDADRIRGEIDALGWEVKDTPKGPALRPKA